MNYSAVRIIKAYISFHRRRDASWDPKQVDENTPRDIIKFITQKCGPVEDGFEGKRVSDLTTEYATSLI